jgi:hypothetical protein
MAYLHAKLGELERNQHSRKSRCTTRHSPDTNPHSVFLISGSIVCALS